MHRFSASRVFVSMLVAMLLTPGRAGAAGADLQPRTAAAFDRYITVTEARLQKDPAFLWIESLPEPRRAQMRDRVHKGELAIERLTTRVGGREIDVPDGLIHH